MSRPGHPEPYAGVVLAVNAGSSSLKAAVRGPEVIDQVTRSGIDPADGLPGALRDLAERLQHKGIEPAAVAHRVVQGGPRHLRTTRVDDDLLADLRAAVPLAPLHLPGAIAVIESARALWPDAVQVACFDTAFHADLPERSRRLPVAAELAARGVHRYGFHGLSVQSVLRAVPDLGPAVVAHLGSGCSVTAVADGRSQHTTMSLTPTGGMVSASRTGDLDPEVVLYLLEQGGYSVGDLRTLLDRRSGLAGLAGGRSDIRVLMAATDPEAVLAVDVFVRSAASAIATCALALDRFETLVFTGGIGEHSAQVRDRVCALLLRLRGAIGGAGSGVGSVVPEGGAEAALTASGVRVLVVPADEQAVLDDETRALLAHSPH